MAKQKPKTTRPKKTDKPNVYTTRSGQKIKLQHSLLQRYVARRDAKELRKAELLRDMPKGRFARILYRLHPKRVYRYWFSREGGIMALKLLGIGFVAGFILLVGVFAYFRKDLPNLKDISGDNIGGSIRYYDKTGQTLLWEDYDAVKRIPVQSEQIAQYVKDATVAIEDREFYKHGGFDLKGITRAGVANLTGGTTSQGGSTITQQLVKLTQDWTKDRSYTRKVKELILSVELERSYSKDEILTGYLNAAPYGNIEYGVEAASRDYFQKPAKELSLDEAAFLAAIPKSPSFYSPYGPYFEDGGKEALIGRMHYTLDVMQQLGKITTKQRDEAKKVDTLAKVKSQPAKYGSITAPYFVLAAKEQLENKFEQTYKRGGWKVTTTLDLGMQKIAEEQVAKGMTQVRRQGGDTAAFVSEDVATGHVVALVGGPDFRNTTFGENNFARLPISPGSSFKAYDYTALMEHTTNFGAGSVLYDTQGELPGYPCTNKARPESGGNCLWNFSRTYSGPITLRYALGGSRNVPAVKAMLIAGVSKTIEVANKLMDPGNGNAYGYRCYPPGTTDLSGSNQTECFSSSAIGDGAYLKLDEHVHGYASLSRNGLNIPQTYILKVVDDANKTLDEWKPSAGTQVIRPDAPYILGDMLSDPNPSYFSVKPQRFNNGKGTWKFSIKTGTTNDAKDGLMLGYTTKYATGVWVGYHDHTKAMTGSMENMTLPIWQGFMRAVHQDHAPVERNKPAGVQTLPAFVVTSHVGYGSIEPSTSTDLYPSWYQNKKVSSKKQTIDVVSNKLATECTPELAKKELSSAGANAFSGDTFAGAGSANTEEKDDIHQCTDNKPTISINVGSGSGNAYSITATIGQGTHALSGNSDKGGGRVNILVDGQIVQTFTIDGRSSYDTSYTPTSSGNHIVTAQVIDSVLYDATSSGETISSINLSQGVAGINVTFSWSGSSGNTTIYTSSGASVCNGTNSCTRPKALLPSGTVVYARDNDGNVSPSVTTSGY
jgi:membrane peptidoglycan carboxypeptidase